MGLSIGPKEIAWTVRKLRSIMRDHGQDPFKRDFMFRPRGPVMQLLDDLLPLINFVRQTGMVLLPAEDRPANYLALVQYSSYQFALRDCSAPRMSIHLLLNLGLAAHREGRSPDKLKQQVSRLCAVLRVANSRRPSHKELEDEGKWPPTFHIVLILGEHLARSTLSHLFPLLEIGPGR